MGKGRWRRRLAIPSSWRLHDVVDHARWYRKAADIIWNVRAQSLVHDLGRHDAHSEDHCHGHGDRHAPGHRSGLYSCNGRISRGSDDGPFNPTWEALDL